MRDYIRYRIAHFFFEDLLFNKDMPLVIDAQMTKIEEQAARIRQLERLGADDDDEE